MVNEGGQPGDLMDAAEYENTAKDANIRAVISGR
jgi:hypothetical protein